MSLHPHASWFVKSRPLSSDNGDFYVKPALHADFLHKELLIFHMKTFIFGITNLIKLSCKIRSDTTWMFLRKKKTKNSCLSHKVNLNFGIQFWPPSLHPSLSKMRSLGMPSRRRWMLSEERQGLKSSYRELSSNYLTSKLKFTTMDAFWTKIKPNIFPQVKTF